MTAPASQYRDERNLVARQRLWQISRRRPAFSLYSWVVGLARFTGGEAVLDVGCGCGAYLELVEAVGLDSSIGMLRAARARARGPLVGGDAMALPFRDGCFEMILAAHVLYHVPDRARALSELRRVLTPGGTLIAVTNGAENQAELVQLVEEVVGHGWRWRRPAERAFSLENGRSQLAGVFDDVQRVECPPGVVEVTNPEVLAGYLDSVADHYEGEVSDWILWRDVVTDCTRRVAAEIRDRGCFPISTSMGAFLCR